MKISDKALNLSKISSINRQINSTMQLPELLSVILETAKDLVKAVGTSLLLAERETGDLAFHTVRGQMRELIKGNRVPRGKGIAGIVAQTGKPLIINDAQNDPRFFSEIDSKSSFVTQHILCVPMIVREELVGVIEAVNAVGRDGFDRQDLRLIQYLADQAAIAITNRRLMDDLTNRIEELTALYEISQSISRSAAEEDIFNGIIGSIARSLSVERCSLLFLDGPRQRLFVKACRGLPEGVSPGMEVSLENTIAGRVVKTGDPYMAGDGNPGLYPAEDNPHGYATRSFVSVPIRSGNEILGVLSIADRKDGGSFDAIHLRVLSTIASQVAEAQRQIVYRRALEAQRRMAQEIEIAAEIQRKILTKIPAVYASHSLAAFNRPAKEVGGDFYDFFPFDEGRYAVLVGDVSGKGIPAALFMGATKSIVRAEMRVDERPRALLKSSNRYIFDNSESGMFVTLFYALIDAAGSSIAYGCAGHNRQMLIRRGVPGVEMLKAGGRALGIVEDSEYEERMLYYGPGDMLVLFTDGVLELLGDMDIDAGEQALAEFFRAHVDCDPSQIIALFQERLSNNAVDSEFIDDFTILSIKF